MLPPNSAASRSSSSSSILDSHPGFGWDTRNRYSSSKILTGNWLNERGQSVLIGGIDTDDRWNTTTRASFSEPPSPAHHNRTRQSIHFSATMRSVSPAIITATNRSSSIGYGTALNLSTSSDMGYPRSSTSSIPRSRLSTASSSSSLTSPSLTRSGSRNLDLSRVDARASESGVPTGIPGLTSQPASSKRKSHRGKIMYQQGSRTYCRHGVKWVPEPIDIEAANASNNDDSTNVTVEPITSPTSTTRRRRRASDAKEPRFSTTSRASFTQLPPIGSPKYGRTTTPITASVFRKDSITRM